MQLSCQQRWYVVIIPTFEIVLCMHWYVVFLWNRVARCQITNYRVPKKNRYEKSYDKSSKVECMLFSNTLCAHLTYIRQHHATTTATTIIIVTMISTTMMIMIIMIIIIIKNNNRNHHWWQQKNRRFWMQIKVRWWFPAFPALLLLCEGKPWSSVVSPCNGRVTRIFDV